MLDRLPLEIQIKLLFMVPNSNLKLINSHFYILYHDLYYHKIVNVFGEDTINVIIKILPWLKPYIKSLDVFRKEARLIIANRLQLEDVPVIVNDTGYPTHRNPLNCQFIKDSWKYIYSILKNKRLYAEYSDYKIDEPSNYIFNHYVEINRTYLLSYNKICWLAPGTYNLNIALAVKNGQGLGTTKFEVKYQEYNAKGGLVTRSQSFYPPTNINEILPKNQFVSLKIGQFTIPSPSQQTSKYYKQEGNHNNKLHQVEISMEEIGLYLKSGFRVYYIDISQPSMLYNEYDLLYYSVNENDYRYFINILLKNLYKALNYVQNGGLPDDASVQYGRDIYGNGDPFTILKQYDKSFLLEYDSMDMSASSSTSSVSSLQDYTLYDNKKILNYGKFFYLDHFKKRYFKFTTIYQQRQFINRFGDYTIDWKDEGKEDEEKVCHYDEDGLKWRIPILGQL
ncbi:hypothetical protein SBY92_003661 [Candida maltosa Xu316]|uniref:Uncharacterized protein n=1 Tax=Candida maltosa (strain Xu316) TaxID=1245528 RepID=M3HRQ0_CANMX|nr:hypothetical protein G210_4760 [Candida maltosa Xu316]